MRVGSTSGATAVTAIAMMAFGCSSGVRVLPGGDAGRTMDARREGAIVGDNDSGPIFDDADPRYVRPDPDAFFAMDPPPRYCFPDGGVDAATTTPPLPGGTPDCPDDKNREGCRCDTVGSTAPCWPGLRVDRGRGVCRDGTTTCTPFDEFGGRWGPCQGAVLPTPGATRGPAACNCFSAGVWNLANVSPCFVNGGDGTTYAVSTYVDSMGRSACPMVSGLPPTPAAGTNWTTNSLRVDCAGSFRLCYALKAGDAMNPTDGDCTLARVCTNAWYPTRDATVELPPLPSWTGSTTECAGRFANSGGYGEMTVEGTSIECDPIGEVGAPYVFNRVPYCPLSCVMNPTTPMCMECRMGGSGMF